MLTINKFIAQGRGLAQVLLKRSPSASIDEWLAAAEYIIAQGNTNILLCERGITAFRDSYTRYALDTSAVAVVRRLSGLPVIVDPSHAAGMAAYVPSLALAAVGAGADGVMVEMHPDIERRGRDTDVKS